MQGANLLIRSDAALPVQSATQYFYAHPFTHTHTHTHTGGAAHLEQFRVQYPAQRTHQLLVEPGIEPPTFWLVDDLLYLLNHSCPSVLQCWTQKMSVTTH